jgi:hypothetical protein
MMSEAVVVKEQSEKFGSIKVAMSPLEVENLSARGYKMIAIFGEEVVAGGNLNFYDNQRQCMMHTDPILAEQARYLMGLDESSSIALVHAELDKSREAHAEASAAKAAAEKTAKEAQSALDVERVHRERYEKACNYASASYEKECELRRKLEGDIGKIERDIGGARMREILAAK